MTDSPSTPAKIVNFVAFQAVWFAVVMSAAEGRPWIGIAAAACWLAAHAYMSRGGVRELLAVLAVAAVGCVADQAAVATGVQRFDPEAATIGLVPVWIAALWAAFATTLNSSMSWMRGRFVTGAILGAIAGPLAYLGAEKLGAVGLDGHERWIVIAALAAEWALMMPIALLLSRIGRAERV